LPDRSKHYGYAQVSIKGARHENQDALYSDGQLFGIYDGHGGKSAAAFSHSEVARCFYSEHTRLSAAATKSLDTDCVTNDDLSINMPTAVKALDCAFLKTQLNLADINCKRSGCTAITCWIEPGGASASSSSAAAAAETEELRRTQCGENDAQETAEPLREARQAEPMKVYAACLGDSMACLFDSRTGGLVVSQQRVWDLQASKQVGTKSSDCITHLHAITGMLQFDDKGSVIGMDNDEQVLG
jgi:serine/threonine protein phosphatase PrpC